MSEKAGDWIRTVGEGGEPAGSTFIGNMNLWIFVKQNSAQHTVSVCSVKPCARFPGHSTH